MNETTRIDTNEKTGIKFFQFLFLVFTEYIFKLPLVKNIKYDGAPHFRRRAASISYKIYRVAPIILEIDPIDLGSVFFNLAFDIFYIGRTCVRRHFRDHNIFRLFLLWFFDGHFFRVRRNGGKLDGN